MRLPDNDAEYVTAEDMLRGEYEDVATASLIENWIDDAEPGFCSKPRAGNAPASFYEETDRLVLATAGRLCGRAKPGALGYAEAPVALTSPCRLVNLATTRSVAGEHQRATLRQAKRGGGPLMRPAASLGTRREGGGTRVPQGI